ncbi:hypothetical protein HDU91_002159 [Kappamyces sp. JEL0680]|nr:hypothetical protein HDU91_002159 [Kappamyces sp. JEL0680]
MILYARKQSQHARLVLISQSVNAITQLVIITELVDAFWAHYLQGLLASGVLLAIVHLNLSILSVYQVLDNRISWKLIWAIKIVFWVLFLLCEVFYNFQQLLSLYISASTYTSLVYVVVAVLYDNLQSMFLIYIVYKNKHHRDQKVIATTKKLALMTLGLNLMDWVGIGLYSARIFLLPHVELFPVCVNVSGLHLNGLLFVFEQLKILTFTGTKMENRNKDLPVHKKSSLKPLPTQTMIISNSTTAPVRT